MNLGALLPANRSFYHDSPGSLTTPPCTMGLSWFVMRDRLTTAPSQVSAFLTAFGGHPNHRDVQALNGRAVTLFTAP